MRRVTATREVVNSARRKCSDSISDMVLFSFFDVLFLMIVLMIWQSPRQQKCEVGISLT